MKSPCALQLVFSPVTTGPSLSGVEYRSQQLPGLDEMGLTCWGQAVLKLASGCGRKRCCSSDSCQREQEPVLPQQAAPPLREALAGTIARCCSLA